VLVASGGVFSEGPWGEWDGAVPYLRRILGFIGIIEIEVVRIEGLNIPDLANRAIPAALERIDATAV
jgi:FMN-dependent NADH-azoreductase